MDLSIKRERIVAVLLPKRRQFASWIRDELYRGAVLDSVASHSNLFDEDSEETIPLENALPSARDFDFSLDQRPVFPVHVSTLLNAYIHSSSGLVYMQRPELYIEEFGFGWGKFRTRTVERFRRSKCLIVDSEVPVYVVSGRGYHGVVEDVGIIGRLVKLGYCFDIIIEKDNYWIRSLLRFLDIAPRHIIPTPRGRWISVRRALVVSKSPYMEFPNRAVIRSAASTLQRASSKISGDGVANHLFISRSDAPSRQYHFAHECEAVFRDAGFEVLRLTDMSIEMQARAFRRANVVVGFHGAGLVNVLWSETAPTLVEFFDETHFNASYPSLAAALGLPYGNVCMRGKELARWESIARGIAGSQ